MESSLDTTIAANSRARGTTDAKEHVDGPRAPLGRRRQGLAVAAVSAAVITALHLGATSIPARAAGAVNSPAVVNAIPSKPGSFAGVVKAVQPAVVHVSTRGRATPTAMGGPQGQMPPQFKEFFERFGGAPRFGAPTPSQGVGSGFVVDGEGHIVTNNHVVSDAEKITVTLNDGTEYRARLIGRDPKTDLALLKVDADRPLPFVSLGDSDTAEVGDWVVAVGSPFGLGGTVTAGIISARGRDINSGPYDDFLQVDAPINRGNSGGPLFDVTGKVIGVNTAIFSPSGGSVGIGFAIPAAQVAPVVEDLKNQGRVSRGWLGLQIQPVTEDIAESLDLSAASGALVAAVLPDSPAAQAGLRTGDVVLEFAGRPIEDARGLSRAAAQTNSGQRVDVEIWRNGSNESISLTVGEMPGEKVASLPPTPAEPTEADTPKLGLALAPLTPEARDRQSLSPARGGVLVANVAPGGPAARKGIQPGDVIVMVGQIAVSNPEELVAAVTASAKRKSVLLLVMREGRERFIAVPFDKA